MESQDLVPGDIFTGAGDDAENGIFFRPLGPMENHLIPVIALTRTGGRVVGTPLMPGDWNTIRQFAEVIRLCSAGDLPLILKGK